MPNYIFYFLLNVSCCIVLDTYTFVNCSCIMNIVVAVCPISSIYTDLDRRMTIAFIVMFCCNSFTIFPVQASINPPYETLRLCRPHFWFRQDHSLHTRTIHLVSNIAYTTSRVGMTTVVYMEPGTFMLNLC